MKLERLLKILRKKGCLFVKHSGNHDKYCQPRTGKVDYIPRHSDISEPLAWKIIKNLS